MILWRTNGNNAKNLLEPVYSVKVSWVRDVHVIIDRLVGREFKFIAFFFLSFFVFFCLFVAVVVFVFLFFFVFCCFFFAFFWGVLELKEGLPTEKP